MEGPLYLGVGGSAQGSTQFQYDLGLGQQRRGTECK